MIRGVTSILCSDVVKLLGQYPDYELRVTETTVYSVETISSRADMMFDLGFSYDDHVTEDKFKTFNVVVDEDSKSICIEVVYTQVDEYDIDDPADAWMFED